MAVLQYLFKWIPFSIVVGVLIGLIAAIFDYFVVLLNSFIVSNGVILHIFPFIVALITGLIIKGNLSIEGPGIGYVLNNIHKKLDFKTFLMKFVSSLFALAGVFIAGREGPSFFMGSSISTIVADYFGIEEGFRDYVVLIGAAAFTAALLKAPLGGAIFALEIRYVSDMDYNPFPQTLIASIFSYIVFSYFRGTTTFITLNHSIAWHLATLPYLMLLGIVVAFFVYIFVTSFYFAGCLSSYIKPVFKPLAGVVLSLPIIFFMFEHDVYNILSVSVNYQALNTIVQTHIPIATAIAYIISIIVLVSLTIGFGISGGLILPNLLIGALIGNAFGFFVGSDFVIFAMAGMAAMLAASAKTPIAAIVLILEISSTDLVIPITAAAITSYIFTYGINIYSSQKVCRVASASSVY